jgi:SAM-dependent methyltransferase
MVAVDLGMEGLQYGLSMGLQRLVQADVASLPFPSGVFDAVVSFDVLVHFALGGEIAAFQEIGRIVKPGGLVLVRVSALDALRSRHSIFASEKQRFTKTRLEMSLRNAGLQVLRCTYANSFLLPAALAKFRIWEPLFDREPSSGVEPVAPWLDELLYKPLNMEAKLLGSGLNLPLGQSLIALARKA